MANENLPLLRASTLTMTAPLTNRIGIDNLFRLLPITYPKTISGMPIQFTKQRTKVPYYGAEGIIISARFAKRSRGARVGGDFMSNVISLDLQVAKKNIHLKISGSKLQLTGALSEEMGNIAFSTTCWHINSIQGHILHITSLSNEIIEKTLNWVIEAVKGAYYETDYEVKEMSDEMIASIPDTIDKRMTTFLLLYAADYRYSSETKLFAYSYRLREIINFAKSPDPRICTGEVQHGNHSVCNGVYNYNIGAPIICSQFAMFVNEKEYPGMTPTFHNSFSSSCKICIPIPSRNSDTKVLSDGTPKISAHRFTINPSGTVKQNSPTCYSEAVDVYYTLAGIIKAFLIANGTLKGELQISAVERDDDESELSDAD